jgi:hypothetical protein
MSFVTHTLQNPTTHSHAVPSNFGFPQTPENGPTGRPTSINLTGFGTVGIQNDQSTHYGSGTAVSNASIKCHLFHDKTKWNKADTVVDSLTFISTKSPANGLTNPRAVDYPLMTWSMMNYYLKFDHEWRSTFGAQNNVRKLQETWALYGVQIGETAGVHTSEHGESMVQEFNTAQRTKCPNYWAALRNRSNHRGTVRQWDKLYLIYRRYRYVGPLNEEFGNDKFTEIVQDYAIRSQLTREKLAQENISDRKRMRVEVDTEEIAKRVKVVNTYYWQIEPYVSIDGRLPPEEVWSSPAIVNEQDCRKVEEEAWTGGFIFIGKVWSVYGEQTISNNVMVAARQCLHPEKLSEEHKRDIAKLPHVELYMRVS